MKQRKFVIHDSGESTKRIKNKVRHKLLKSHLSLGGGFSFLTFKVFAVLVVCIGISVSTMPEGIHNNLNAVRAVSVQTLQQQAAQIASEISSENNQLDQLDQQYLTAQQNLAVINQKISDTQVQIAGLTSSESNLKIQIRKEALAAFVEAESGQGLSGLLNSNATTIGIKETYLESATGNLSASVASLVNVQNKLTAVENSLSQQQNAEQQQMVTLNQAKNTATQVQANLINTENGLKGQISTLVAQQEAKARAAAAAAAVARFRQEQAAQAAAMAAAAATSMLNGGGSATIPVISGSGSGVNAVKAAMSYIGVWYKWGGTSRSGVDCSGLTMLAWEAAGVQLPRTAQEQYDAIAHVSLTSPSQWQPGDLVFYGYGTSGISHVAMYIGGGEVVQALETGTQVQVNSMFYAGSPVGIGQP